MGVSPHHSVRSSNRAQGFTLLEAVVALAVLGVALTSMLTLLAQHAAVDRRVDAHLGALRALEAHHEALRGFWVPDPDQPLWQSTKTRIQVPPIMTPEETDTFLIWAETEPLAPTGLFRLVLDVRYTVGTKTYTQRLETRFWRG